MLSGITLIRNGELLSYPYIQCIENMLSCCDIVVVAAASNNDDHTLEVLRCMVDDHPGKLFLSESIWDLGETDAEDFNIRVDGAIARAKEIGATSVLYCQADEVIHPDRIKEVVAFYPPERNNVYLERSYLWGDLKHINMAWTMKLCRLCPITPELRAVEAAMTLSSHNEYPDIYVPSDICRMFHYSRVGDTKNIAIRLNSLRKLFDCKVEPLDDYTFGGEKKYESAVYDTDIIEVELEHPPLMEEFYK
jgi:hypothetical protein